MSFWFFFHISSSSLEVFHRLIPLSGFSLQFPITSLGGYSSATLSFKTHQLFYVTRIFSLVSWFSSSVSFIGFKGFLPDFYSRFFLNRRFLFSAELALKKEGNYNVMVTRSTNHMISTRDHLHDLVTWSWHMTYKLHSNIKSLLIQTSASSLPCHDYILVFHLLYLQYFYILVSSILQYASSVYCGRQTRCLKIYQKYYF